MGFLGYGAAKGLGQQHDFQRDIDRLYQREAYRAQITAQKEQKARYYGELMKEHKAESPWIRSKLEDRYKELNSQIADFAIENPNFETDVNKMQEMLSMTDGYLNNDLVRMDKQSAQQYQTMIAAFNNGIIDEDQWFEESEKYDNWLQNGTDGGDELSNGYTFNGSRLPEYSDILKASNAAVIGAQTLRKEGNMFMNVTEFPEQGINSRALLDMQDRENAKVIEREYAKAEEQFPGLYKNAYDYHVKNLSIGEAEKKTFAAWDPAYTTDLAIKKKMQTEMSMMNPYWSQNIAPNFKLGGTIKNHKGLEIFTPAGKINGTWDLGAEGTEVKVDDGEGGFKNVVLNGTMILTNTEEMKVMSDGAYIKANFRTNINPTEEQQVERYKVTVDGVPTEMEVAEYTEWKNSLKGLSDKESALLGKGEEVRVRDPEVDGRWNQIKVETSQISKTFHDQFNEAGFTSSGTYSPGIQLGFDKETGTFPVYRGSVWVPANISTETLNAYEGAQGGATHKQKINEYQQNAPQSVVLRALSEGNQQFATEYLNDTYGGRETVYLTDAGKPASAANYDEKREMSGWTPSSTEQGVVWRTDTITKKDPDSGEETTQKVHVFYNAIDGQLYQKSAE